MTLEPGWYPDQDDPSRNLYWDGRNWHRNGAPAAPFQAPPPQAKRRGCFGTLIKTALLLVGGLVVLAACIGFLADSDKNSSSSSSSASSVNSSPRSSTEVDTRELAFLATTKAQGLDQFFNDVQDAVDTAKGLCLYYADDSTRFFERGVQEIQGLHPEMTFKQAAQFAHAATQAYCPEFAR